ncbi:uncharacterized protein ARMOST_07947 [Armillaria ostoyae]|uniref:Uncharacterized protein n=1 Tax=Armillaria ostoyae TaxID=47428 RepID=A0A284R7A7_ARMOS|nr:uncharacterized protein ARMOST_07947 [Armillaria ostoyae]
MRRICAIALQTPLARCCTSKGLISGPSSNTADEGVMPVTPTPIYSTYVGSRVFSPSHDTENTPLAPVLMSSPYGSSNMYHAGGHH